MKAMDRQCWHPERTYRQRRRQVDPLVAFDSSHNRAGQSSRVNAHVTWPGGRPLLRRYARQVTFKSPWQRLKTELSSPRKRHGTGASQHWRRRMVRLSSDSLLVGAVHAGWPRDDVSA